MSASLPRDGGCMCGEVKVRVSAAPLITMACHCAGCQKLSASAFSLSALIPADGFEITKGEPLIGALHGASRYFYCPRCLNWLFTRPAGMDMFVNIRPSMFDEPSWSTPFMETCTSEKLPWAATPAIHSYEQYPQASEYGPLMAEYAGRRT